MIRFSRPPASALVGAFILLAAASIAAGWFLQLKPVVQAVPGAVMVLATALGFLCVGFALASEMILVTSASRALQTISGAVVALLGVVVLAEHATDTTWIIDWTALHRNLAYDSRHPGRMSVPTAVTLALAGATMLLMNRVNTTWRGIAVQALTALVATSGVVGIVGWMLRLPLVYENYVFGQMALQTAIAFVLTGFALWLCWRRMDWYRLRGLIADEGLRISVNATSMLAIMLTATLASGYALVARQLQASERVHVLDPLRRLADHVRLNLELRSAQATMIAESALHATLMRSAAARRADDRILAQLRGAVEQLLSHGFSAVAFQGPSGQIWAEAGSRTALTDFELALSGGGSSLLWRDGFVLRVRTPIRQDQSLVGWLLTEQPLPGMTAALTRADEFGATGAIAICGRGGEEARCFSRQRNPMVFRLAEHETPPAARALRGDFGVVLQRDGHGAFVFAAYGPVSPHAIALVAQMSAVELYAPLRQQLHVGLVLLLAMIAIGTLLLHWRVAPLGRRLHLQEQRLKLALDSSRSAVWDLDIRSGVVYLSEQWPALLGGTPQASSTQVTDLYELVHPEDVPQLQSKLRAALTNDALSYDVEHRVRTPSGDWTWIHSVGRVVERDLRGRAVRMIGINTNIARRKQAQSFIERRASRDEATELPNRAVFTDRLHMAMARARRAPPDRSLMAVICLGIEEQKTGERRTSHIPGKTLLRAIAQRTKRCVRATDSVARIGVDEFAVILEELGLTDQACGVAEKIISAMHAEADSAAGTLGIAANIGISFYDGVIEVSAEDLVAKAQNAMHEARNGSLNSYLVAP